LKVHNKYHKNIPKDAVYVGRGSLYGNPFMIGKDGNRDEVCDKFEEYLSKHLDLVKQIKTNLRGKDLICFCKPQRCHGDYLLELANSGE